MTACELLFRLVLCCSWAATTVASQDENPPPEQHPLVAHYGIEVDAAQLFSKVEPEFLRYQTQLRFYGTTLAETQPAPELVDAEVAMYRLRRSTGKLEKPGRTDALLCFNLLLHRPDVGRDYLKELTEVVVPGTDGFVDSAIAYGTMASGSWGEQFAVAGLDHDDVSRRRFWATYLSREATVDNSATRIRDVLKSEKDSRVRASLYLALGTLIDKGSLAATKAAFEKEEDVDVRRAMVFAVTETMGRDALAWLGSLEEANPQVREQIDGSTQYLREGTTEDNKHGFEITNDAEFVQRFHGLKTPAIQWLTREGFLADDAVANGKDIGDDEKAELFDALEQSLGFGLEAVKGSLFAALKPADLPRLRKLRALCAYCPNQFAQGRRQTLLIMIRSLRD